MQVTGTHFNYYHVCKRKLWLFASGINMENNSDLVLEGKLIHEGSYSDRSDKYQEFQIDGVKVDFYDARNKVIHEIKKSNKLDEAHEWQLKFYIYTFEQNGIEGVTGILEYPTLRKTQQVELDDNDRKRISEIVKDIDNIIDSDQCPEKVDKKYCRNCSYFDFCYCGEVEEE
ncbi:MAG: CRISPR-associated protein Cas4 [Bacteroidales bacterium]|nr:CRISPR-associated protein Cas4 [Bacteroidales bacterium]